MGLVVHAVTLNTNPDPRLAFTNIPFEVAEVLGLESAEEVWERLESGLSVPGLRLWLDRPTPPEMLGLKPDPEMPHIPNRVRVVIREANYVLHRSHTYRVEPWKAGRIIRYEEA